MGGNYTRYNAEAIDGWVRGGWEWGIPISRAGEWQVLLTPNLPVPRSWFGDLKGKKLLGLVLTDIYEDTNSRGPLKDYGVPCFLATRAIRPEKREVC